MNQTEWDATVNGKNYSFTYACIDNKHIITVNGAPIEIKRHFLSVLLGFDEKFTFDGMEGRLLLRRKMTGKVQTPGINVEPEIVLNGILLQSGEKYVKRTSLVVILAMMCIFIPLVILGGPYFLLGYIFMTAFTVAFRPSSLDSISFVTFLAVIFLILGLLIYFNSYA